MKLPHYKVITDKVIFGDSKMCRIRINPHYTDDKGLLAHEERHVKQWYISMLISLVVCTGIWLLGYRDIALGLFIISACFKDLLYMIWPWFRLKLEIDAARAQLDAGGWKYLDNVARTLAYNYDFDISFYEAKNLIKG